MSNVLKFHKDPPPFPPTTDCGGWQLQNTAATAEIYVLIFLI